MKPKLLRVQLVSLTLSSSRALRELCFHAEFIYFSPLSVLRREDQREPQTQKRESATEPTPSLRHDALRNPAEEIKEALGESESQSERSKPTARLLAFTFTHIQSFSSSFYPKRFTAQPVNNPLVLQRAQPGAAMLSNHFCSPGTILL